MVASTKLADVSAIPLWRADECPAATVKMPLRENTAGPCTCNAVFPEATTPVPLGLLPHTPVPPTLTPTTPSPKSLVPSTPVPLIVVPRTALPDPLAKQVSTVRPAVEFVMLVKLVDLLAWPRMTGSPFAAAAGAGRTRASAVTTAARAPLPPASNCLLLRRATPPLAALSVFLA